MIAIDTLTVFLGGCSVINIGVFVVTCIMLIMLQGLIVKINSRLFGLNQENLPSTYFQYLGNYKKVMV